MSSYFHHWVKGAIVQEQWWQAGFSESWAFSPLFVNFQGSSALHHPIFQLIYVPMLLTTCLLLSSSVTYFMMFPYMQHHLEYSTIFFTRYKQGLLTHM
jgi:hypothetical protein